LGARVIVQRFSLSGKKRHRTSAQSLPFYAPKRQTLFHDVSAWPQRRLTASALIDKAPSAQGHVNGSHPRMIQHREATLDAIMAAVKVKGT
jgi:hypothetical protein